VTKCLSERQFLELHKHKRYSNENSEQGRQRSGHSRDMTAGL